MAGSVDGKIEAWDTRSRERVGTLDCAMDALAEEAASSDQVSSIFFELKSKKSQAKAKQKKISLSLIIT